jgi:hypothetical protein
MQEELSAKLKSRDIPHGPSELSRRQTFGFAINHQHLDNNLYWRTRPRIPHLPLPVT